MLAEEIGQWMTGLSPGSRGRVAKSDQVIEGHSPKPLLGSPQTLGQHIEPVERRRRFVAVVGADTRTFSVKE